MSFAAGESLCVQGGDSPECYVIVEGEAEVSICGRRIRTVGEDDVVGERALLENRPRTASVVATTHMNTWAISRERMLTLVETNATVKASMLEHVRGHYADS